MGIELGEKEKWLSEALQKTRDIVGVPTYSAFGDGKWFYTAKPISWMADGDISEMYDDVHVPIGFVTDLTSIPKIFWSVIPRDGRYLSAAIIHDYSYWFQHQPRQAADQIFNIGMKELGVSNSIRLGIFGSVRAFGSSAWKFNSKLRSEGERRIMKHLPEKPTTTWVEWKQKANTFLNEE